MPIIDADTHCDENEETWEYLEGSDRRFTPVTVVHQTSVEGQQPKGYDRYWLIDGRLKLRRVRDDVRTGTVQATRELRDVQARLRHMDELGTDIQVIYPTLFLAAVSPRPEVETALCKAYNRWLAARCAQSGGRLRWVAVMPTLNMEAAVDEVRFAKENGACAVMKKGLECGNRSAGDPHFYPLYEQASRLDIAVCLHLGCGDPSLTDAQAFSTWGSILPILDAFISLVVNGVPDRFPRLRVGFIEAGASWLPYVLSDLEARHERASWLQSFDLKQDLLRACRFYVALQTQEDLTYLVQHGAADSLVAGSDYTHADQSAEVQALRVLRDRADRGDADPSVIQRILNDNARALYGI